MQAWVQALVFWYLLCTGGLGLEPQFFQYLKVPCLKSNIFLPKLKLETRSPARLESELLFEQSENNLYLLFEK